MWPQRCFQALSNLRPSSPRGRAAFFRQRRRHQKFRTWRCICLRPLPGAQMALSGKTKHDPNWHASGFLPSSGASAPAVACAWHVLCRIMPPNRSGSRRHPACRACSGAESQGSATPGLCFRFRHKNQRIDLQSSLNNEAMANARLLEKRGPIFQRNQRSRYLRRA